MNKKIKYFDIWQGDENNRTQLARAKAYNIDQVIELVKTEFLKPNTEYMWLTEIADANKYSDINMTIYQPHQHFKIS